MNDTTPPFRLATPVGLLQRILHRVELEKIRHRLRRSLAIWCSLTFVSVAGLVTAGTFFYQEAVISGFNGYLSQLWALTSVNPALVLAHWNEILTSIGETLPVIGLTITVAAIGLALWSADKVVSFGRKWKTI